MGSDETRLTFEEWSGAVKAELAAAGFEADDHQGFPIVRRSISFERKYALLKLSLSMPVEKRIYSDGVLFLPLAR